MFCMTIFSISSRRHAKRVVQRVHFLVFLQKPPAVGGIEMRGTLIQQEPLKIEDKPKTLGSFKEHWRWETCRISLGRGKLGLTFHGSEIGTNAAKALLHVAPFVQQPAIRQAFNESRT